MHDPKPDSSIKAGESSPPAWAQFELLVAHLSDGVTVQDRSGRTVYANEVAAQTSGYATAEELLAAPTGDYSRMFEVMTEDGEPIALEELPGRRALVHGKADGVLQVRVRATNVVRWSDVRSFVVRDDSGEAMFVVNVFRDVTDRIIQQRLLEAQTQELETQSAHAQLIAEELEQSNEQLADALKTEHEALRREAYLSRATDLLSESLDFEATLQRVAALVVPDLADWTSVDLLSEATGELRQLAVAHTDPEKIRWARQLHEQFPRDMDAARGIPNVLRTGLPEFHQFISDESIAASARNDEELSLLRTVGLRSVMIVPLRAHQRIVGTITLVTAESNRSYTESDLAFAVELGRRAGMAIERAALHQDTVRARDAASAAYRIAEERARWLARLQLLTGELSRSTTSSDVIDAATTLGRELFEADRGSVWMFEEGRQTLSLAGGHPPPEDTAAHVRSMSIAAPYPIADAVRSDELVLVEDLGTMLARYPGLADVPGMLETHARAAVPLKVGGEVIGGLAYAYNSPRSFSDDYITALRTFSRELGQSLQRTKTMADLMDSRTAADS
ncbi:MAG: GAF domain-containing protein, partial [bacterium]